MQDLTTRHLYVVNALARPFENGQENVFDSKCTFASVREERLEGSYSKHNHDGGIRERAARYGVSTSKLKGERGRGDG